MERHLPSIRNAKLGNLALPVQQFPGSLSDGQMTLLWKHLPGVTAVAAKANPVSGLQSCNCKTIARHMTWRLNDPEAAVAKVVHRSIKGTELLPWPGELLHLFGRTLRIEVSSVPLHAGVLEMSWRASFFCSRAKHRCSLGEYLADRPAMIPMCMTG
jgi:hypothetical protein